VSSALPGLRVELETRPFERAEGELAVATFFEEDRPLRGAASRADWRLCGLLSELLAAERLRGGAGEALLVPTYRRLQVPRVLLLGLGSAARFGAAEVSAALEDAVERILDLGVRSAVVGLPGDWTGAVPARPAAEASARGALAVLARRPADLELRLLVPAASVSRASRGLEAAESRARALGVALRLPDPGAARGARVRGAAATRPAEGEISPASGRP